MKEDSIKILLAHGNETFVTYVSILLNRMGIDKVIPAESGRETLRLLEMLTPDVLILSEVLSDADGLDILRQIKKDERLSRMPVVLVSDEFDLLTHEECVKLGCANYLVKPVSVYSLHRSVQDCITFVGGKKRKFLRTAVDKKVTVKSGDSMHELRALTLSEGGVYLRTKSPLPVGTRVEVSMVLRNDIPVTLQGNVIYHQRTVSGTRFRVAPGMAVKFKDIGIGEAMILRDYITEILARDLVEEQDVPVLAI